jgi:hypothetical protein
MRQEGLGKKKLCLYFHFFEIKEFSLLIQYDFFFLFFLIFIITNGEEINKWNRAVWKLNFRHLQVCKNVLTWSQVDLERRFGRKLQHDFLFSCLGKKVFEKHRKFLSPSCCCCCYSIVVAAVFFVTVVVVVIVDVIL